MQSLLGNPRRSAPRVFRRHRNPLLDPRVLAAASAGVPAVPGSAARFLPGRLSGRQSRMLWLRNAHRSVCRTLPLARMFHTPLYGLRADCRQSAGRARWPAHPGYRQNRPQKAPHGDRQDSKAFLSQPSFLSRLGRLVTFRRGGFALARISSDHCQQMCRMQISDRWVGKNCEICGLAGK